MSRVGAVLIGIVGILRLEEVDPALGQANGSCLLAGTNVLPVPSTAVDVQAGTHRLQRRGNEVFQGSLTGDAAHRRGVVRRNKGFVQLRNVVILIHKDADGVAGLDRGTCRDGRAACGGGDLIAGGSAGDKEFFAVQPDVAGADRRDHTVKVAIPLGCCRDHAVGDSQIVEVAFLQAVLDSIALGSAGEDRV